MLGFTSPSLRLFSIELTQFSPIVSGVPNSIVHKLSSKSFEFPLPIISSVCLSYPFPFSDIVICCSPLVPMVPVGKQLDTSCVFSPSNRLSSLCFCACCRKMYRALETTHRGATYPVDAQLAAFTTSDGSLLVSLLIFDFICWRRPFPGTSPSPLNRNKGLSVFHFAISSTVLTWKAMFSRTAQGNRIF